MHSDSFIVEYLETSFKLNVSTTFVNKVIISYCTVLYCHCIVLYCIVLLFLMCRTP